MTMLRYSLQLSLSTAVLLRALARDQQCYDMLTDSPTSWFHTSEGARC